MGRGLLYGAFWGLIVGALVLGVASLLGVVPTKAPPEASLIVVPAGSEFDSARDDLPVARPSSERPAQAAQAKAPVVEEPGAPLAPTRILGEAITQSAVLPEATGAVGALATPPAGADGNGVEIALLETQPSGLLLEDSARVDTAAGGLTPTRLPDVPNPAEPLAAAQPVAAAPEATLAAPETNGAPQETTRVAPEAPPLVALDIPALTQPSPLPETGDVLATPRIDTAPVASQAERVAALTAQQDTLPSVTTRGFGNRATGVVVNLQGVTAGVAGGVALGDTLAAATPDALPDITTESLQELDRDPRALARYASNRNWDGQDGRPLFSLVLIDEAADASRLPALASFDGPLTIAVPGGAAGAREAMAAYRAAGHEVVILADLPQGANPGDVETVMGGYLQSVPEAVAVLDGSLAGFRGDRRVVEQVVEILDETGHGLLTVDQGLNTTRQIARQRDVPVETIFRDLDAKGQGNTVIRRFLDQAAFRAGQDGRAVLLARMRAETISALLIWHQQERARRVNLAPLSAVLLSGFDS